MDIASLSTTLSQYKLMSDVSTAMLSKSFDVSENVSKGLTDMIDSVPASTASINGIGINIDITL